MTGQSLTIHASSICLDGRGVLLRGPAGTGKSTLCLDLIFRHRATLVADDQVVVSRKARHLTLSGLQNSKGRIEIRGAGILQLPYRRNCTLGLIVDLLPAREQERLPCDEALKETLLDIDVPRIFVDATKPAATSRIAAVLKFSTLPQM